MLSINFKLDNNDEKSQIFRNSLLKHRESYIKNKCGILMYQHKLI